MRFLHYSLVPLSATRRWTVIGLLATAMVIGLLDRINFSVALAVVDFQHRFRLTDSDRGLLNSAFFWTYTALQPRPDGSLIVTALNGSSPSPSRHGD